MPENRSSSLLGGGGPTSNKAFTKNQKTVTSQRIPGPKIGARSDGQDEVAAIVGMKVTRGPDWLWGNQDTADGVNGVGVITRIADEKNWVSARFGSTERNYRAGVTVNDSGQPKLRYDLRLYLEVEPMTIKKTDDSVQPMEGA